MKLFVAKGSCSLASHIALEEAAASYTVEKIDLAKGDQNSEAYRAVNPKSRVPALVTDRGILTETPAILAFVAQSHPDAGLAPVDDPFAFAEIQAFMSYMSSTVHVAHAHGRRGTRWADDQSSLDDMKRKLPEVMGKCFDMIEQDMFKGPWVMGDAYSIADPYLFTIARWLESDGVDPKRFPRILDHGNRMEERSAVKAVLASY
ncbi:glutathione S-transferase family protein [Agrobacterium sp. ES01]|uniref:glutathione S-transferase family protein n=1 Tax=Agrobacterium sp. ES01 TaxID=3420714 RepID=UPI003D151611